MNEEEKLKLNLYIDNLYSAMLIGDIVLEPKHSSELYNLIIKLLEENKQLKQQLEQRDRIINKANELIHKHIKEIENLKLRIYPKEYYDLLEILNIDKGE